MARQTRSRGRRAPLRKFIWARTRNVGFIVPDAPDSNVINLLQNFQDEYGAQLIGSTVMRVRGALAVHQTGSSNNIVTTGIRVAQSTGTVATADGPISDDHADWMAYMPAVLISGAGTDQWYNSQRFDVDIKAARKLEELGESLQLFVQSFVAGQAPEINYDLSIGIKLP